MATDPTNVTRWKHKLGFHNREYNGTSGRAKGTIGAGTAPQGRCDVQFVRVDETSNGKKEQRKRESVPTKKLRDLTPLVLEVPTEDEKLTLEIRERQYDGRGLGQQPCQTEDEGKYHRERPESLEMMAGSSSGFTTLCCRLGDSYLSGTQQGSRVLWERRQRS